MGKVELEMEKTYARVMPSLHYSAYYVRPGHHGGIQIQLHTMIWFIINFNILFDYCELFSNLPILEIFYLQFIMKKTKKNVRCKKSWNSG